MDTRGHRVCYNKDGHLTHIKCPETDLDKDAKKPVCPDCFMIHPEGACDA